jgi:hypothetical protein
MGDPMHDLNAELAGLHSELDGLGNKPERAELVRAEIARVQRLLGHDEPEAPAESAAESKPQETATPRKPRTRRTEAR